MCFVTASCPDFGSYLKKQKKKKKNLEKKIPQLIFTWNFIDVSL